MASPTIDVHCDAPDPAQQPATFTDACAIIDTLLRADFSGADDYIPYVKGSTTPAVEDQGKVWIQENNSGQPLGIKIFFNGNWRKIGNGKLGEVTMFIGDPSGVFDANGVGIAGGEWDGWIIMNGINSSPDFSDRFVVGAHMNKTAGIAQYGSGGWQTAINGGAQNQGGQKEVTPTVNQTRRPANDAVEVDLFSATGDGRSTTGALFGKHSALTGDNGKVTLIAADPGNTDPDPINIVNPFNTVCFCQYIGIS